MFQNQLPVYIVCFNGLHYIVKDTTEREGHSSETDANKSTTTANELGKIGSELEARLSDIDQKIVKMEADGKTRKAIQKKQLDLLDRCTS